MRLYKWLHQKKKKKKSWLHKRKQLSSRKCHTMEHSRSWLWKEDSNNKQWSSKSEVVLETALECFHCYQVAQAEEEGEEGNNLLEKFLAMDAMRHAQHVKIKKLLFQGFTHCKNYDSTQLYSFSFPHYQKHLPQFQLTNNKRASELRNWIRFNKSHRGERKRLERLRCTCEWAPNQVEVKNYVWKMFKCLS